MKRVVMEVDQTQRKYARISNGNGRFVTAILDQTAGKMDDMYQDEDDDGEHKRRASNDAVRGGASAADLGGGVGRFYGGWPSSRIVRVSRATGGKDRHSKVLTSKGLRDRRVRLSVNTAIQFYDLQDRLGFDQPSKAVEWLLKAAASSITELPPMLNSPFPDTPKQLSDEKKSSTGGSNQLGLDSVDMDSTAVGDPSYLQQQQITTKSSACSSTSETSKGSGLSLSRSETRAKARERAKGRAADKKDKDNEPSLVSCLNLNPISQTSSFTELLSGGLNNGNTINHHHHHHHQQNPIRGTTNESNFFLKSPKQWSSTMDYFTSGHFGHSDLQQFSFAQDHLIPVINAATGVNSNNNSNNLNFTISTSGNNSSSGLAAEFNRGTLQSNSTSLPSQLPHLQRFCPIDGSSQSFFTGAATPAESHHQFLSGYDAGRLQLYYGDAHDNAERHAGHKGKGKH